jgi:hypothetical protein
MRRLVRIVAMGAILGGSGAARAGDAGECNFVMHQPGPADAARADAR